MTGISVLNVVSRNGDDSINGEMLFNRSSIRSVFTGADNNVHVYTCKTYRSDSVLHDDYIVSDDIEDVRSIVGDYGEEYAELDIYPDIVQGKLSAETTRVATKDILFGVDVSDSTSMLWVDGLGKVFCDVTIDTIQENTGGGVPFKDDILLHYDSYTDYIFNEKNGNNAEIVGFPSFNFNSDFGGYGIIQTYQDDGQFDINETGELTLTAWIKTPSSFSTQYIAGKLVAGSVSGRYGIFLTAGGINAGCQDDSGWTSVGYNPGVNTWVHVGMTVKENGELQLWVDGSKQGSPDEVGTFSSVDSKYEFHLGNGNSSSGTAFTGNIFTGNMFDVRLYDFELSEAQMLNVYQGNYLGSEKASYSLCDYSNIGGEGKMYDGSGNGHHLINNGDLWSGDNWSYETVGFKKGIDVGYSVYMDIDSVTNYDEYLLIPYGIDGNPINIDGSDLISGYVNVNNVSGGSLFFNMFPCIIDFDPEDGESSDLSILDRSDTDIHKAASRSSSYYDASNPYRYHSFELSIDKIKTFFEDDYLWRLFPHMNDNSVFVDERERLYEIIVYTTAKSETEKNTVLSYTGDYNKFFTWSFEFESTHIAATRESKLLYCDDAGTLTLSLDGGDTIENTLDASSDISIVTFAHIFENGNILFCGQRKAYLSDDGLDTYSEISAFDHEGNAYNPTSDGVFRSIGNDYINHNGEEILMWGCYATEADTAFDDINLWVTTDSGSTINSVWKAGVSSPVIDCRHIHGAHYNHIDGSFWFLTGDGELEGENCAWIRGEYNGESFNWELIDVDDGSDGSYRKTIGMHFYQNYIYWGTDKTGDTLGVWRTPISAPVDEDSHESLFLTIQSLGLKGDGSEIILTNGGADKRIAISPDAKHFYAFDCDGGDALNSPFYLTNVRTKNSQNQYVIDQTITDYPNFTQGESLLVTIERNK